MPALVVKVPPSATRRIGAVVLKRRDDQRDVEHADQNFHLRSPPCASPRRRSRTWAETLRMIRAWITVMISREAAVSVSSSSDPERSAPKKRAVTMVPIGEPLASKRSDQAVEAETGREALHETVVDAERLDAAGQSADRARDDSTQKPRRCGCRRRHTPRISAPSRSWRRHSRHGVLRKYQVRRRQHEADRQAPVQPRESEQLRQVGRGRIGGVPTSRPGA